MLLALLACALLGVARGEAGGKAGGKAPGKAGGGTTLELSSETLPFALRLPAKDPEISVDAVQVRTDLEEEGVGYPPPLDKEPWTPTCEAVCDGPTSADGETIVPKACALTWPYVLIVDSGAKRGQPDYAARTTPCILDLKTSNIPDSGLGVFTKVPLKAGMIFGPLSGELVQDFEDASYVWTTGFQDQDGNDIFTDASNPALGNWLRFVNSARWREEQNLLSTIHFNKVFFVLTKDLGVGEELLTYYGNDFLTETLKHKITGEFLDNGYAPLKKLVRLNNKQEL